MNKFITFFKKLTLAKKITILLIICGLVLFVIFKIKNSSTSQPQYQTAIAEKKTLVVSVTGSGQVSTSNNSSINTQASGVVSQVYVKDGDLIKMGDKIAEIELDLSGQQNASSSLASYQSAKNNLETAKTNLYTLQADMFTDWKTHFDLATNGTYQNSDGSPNNTNRALVEYHVAENTWLASEAKYKNQQNVVVQAQNSLNSAWLAYQKSSPIIYAPISGYVSGLSLQVGSVITQTQSSTTNDILSTKIATVRTKALPSVTINLTEIDVLKIKIGNRATITFDAIPDKTYTGKVVSIDLSGSVSSGVTTYPTVIRLDNDPETILANMAASANIITQAKDNILLVPSSSIQTQNDQVYIRVLKNNKLQEVNVEIGLSSDSETEIISGIKEGDVIITSITQTTTQTQQSRSPFSGAVGIGSGRNFAR